MNFMDLGECLRFLKVPLVLVHSRKNCFIHNKQCDELSLMGKGNPIPCDQPLNSNDIHSALYNGTPRL